MLAERNIAGKKITKSRNNFGLSGRGWHEKRTDLKFKVFEYLKKKKFPYEVPHAIKNNKGGYLSSVKGRKFWIYNFIEGEIKKEVTLKEFKEIAKALALYHNMIESLTEKDTAFFHHDWLISEYEKFKKLNGNKKEVKIVQENSEYIINLLQKLKRIKYEKR